VEDLEYGPARNLRLLSFEKGYPDYEGVLCNMPLGLEYL
jgi:hypothetical protein